MKSRTTTRPIGLAGYRSAQGGLKNLPLDEFADAHQWRLKGRYIKGLNELIEEPGIAEGDKTCHGFLCTKAQPFATQFRPTSSFRVCPYWPTAIVCLAFYFIFIFEKWMAEFHKEMREEAKENAKFRELVSHALGKMEAGRRK